jgi:hypothetical protein
MKVIKKFNYEVIKGEKCIISVYARTEKDSAYKLNRFINHKKVSGVILTKDHQDDGFIEGTERLVSKEYLEP